MAEQIISPGVFTRENDLSFLPQGVGAIGAAIIGPTVKGPAFVPTVVRSFAEYERRFGGLHKETFIPQTVREYLKNAGSVTVCRVLAGGGYEYVNGTNEIVVIGLSGSRSTAASLGGSEVSGSNIVLSVLFPSKATSTPNLEDTTMVGPGGSGSFGQMDMDFSITLKGSGGTSLTAGKQLSASMDPNNDNYLIKQLGFNPNNSKTSATGYGAGTGATGAIPAYTYNNWEVLQSDVLAATTKEVSTITLFSGKMPTGSIGEMHANTAPSDVSGSIVITSADNKSTTLIFASSSVTAHTSTSTGSVVYLDSGYAGGLHQYMEDNADYVATAAGHISGSDLADLITGSLQSLTDPGFTVSSAGNILTITNTEAGTAPDIIMKGFLNTGGTTASLSTTTQGADVSGYVGINADRDLIMETLGSGALLKFDGGIGQTEGYGYATTPWIKSQFLDSNKTTKELFKFHTISHGTICNTDYKISIANLKEPSDIDNEEQYSQFSVLIRKFDDGGDKNLNGILEQFNNVTLNPDSPRYISRIIGDRYPQYNDTLDKVELLGNYPNISNYVRVEVNELVSSKAYSPKYSPKGFAAVINPIPMAALANYATTPLVIPSASYEGTQVVGGNYSSRGYLGWKFQEKAKDNWNWIKPLPTVQESNVSGEFNVENYFGHASSSIWSGSLSASLSSSAIENSQLKFTVPFQGGDDGIRPDIVRVTGNESPNAFVTGYSTGANLYGFDVNATSDAGYKGYKKAINILSNQDEYDINMLALPGVNYATHPLIANAGIDMCEDRGDAFYVMDLNTVDASVKTAVNNVAGLDTNYAAVYYPWVKVLDTAQNKPVMVPPSVIVPGAIAQSDRIAAEWFAPAGLNRGVLGNVIEAKIRLNQAERDVLYDAKINPIATFPQTGVCIWGQKTLQERSTALDRINVRRLLIALKKFIASSSKYLVFEQNTATTRMRFLNIVNPYLESVQQKQGLYAFRVQMDEGNNPADVIDRNQLVGGIYLQPTKTAEFIVLDFNILPTGATFPV